MYERITKETRKKVSKLTLQQQRELNRLYSDAIKELSKRARNSRRRTLTNRWLIDYKKELERSKRELGAEISKRARKSTKHAAELGSEGQQLIMSGIFAEAGIDPGEHFTEMLSKVNDNIVKDIISGGLYKDNKTLSDRIWSYGEGFEKDIQYTINQAILEKKSAIELANDLEVYVREPARRGSNWGKAYPHLRGKKVDYNAIRLARTSINHAYQTSTVQSSSINPFTQGIKWQSAKIHGRTCEVCIARADEDRYGLGAGVFPIKNVPLDHPNGLCTMLPHIPQTLDEVAGELRDWIDGGSNQKLDSWYEKHGLYFAGKAV